MKTHTDEETCWGCEKKLETAHPYLREWFHRVKAKHDIPGGMRVHVCWAYRGPEDQNAAYRDGKSNCLFPNSAHNKSKDGRPRALALDLFLIDADGVARFPWKFYQALAETNKEDGEPLLWGGNVKLHNGRPDGDHFQLLQEEGLEILSERTKAA